MWNMLPKQKQKPNKNKNLVPITAEQIEHTQVIKLYWL